MVKEDIIAERLAKEQRSISISEFFLKNKHLLGFDNPRKALLTTIKEAIDNSLDACEEARILPDIVVKVKDLGVDRFEVVVEDNGPGIVKQQIPNIFGKLLYGSKFHKLKCSRGQQGIGICMTPDTLVPLGDGKVLPIKEIVETKPNADLFTLMPNLKLSLGKINKFWKIPSPAYLIKIKTLTGRKIKLTPENPVFVRNSTSFEWKDAEDVKIGDYVAISRKLGTHIKNEKIPLIDLLDEDTRVDNYIFVMNILDKLRKLYKTWKGVGKRFDIDKEQIKGWRKKNIGRRPTIKLLKRFCEELNISKEELINNCQKVGKLGTYVKIPKYINQDFMKFLGYISGDGHSQSKRSDRWGRNISLWNNDKNIRKNFENIVNNLFGLNPKELFHSKRRGVMMYFSSSLIARLINNCGIPSGKKNSTFRLNQFLQRKDLLRPYLKALFDCEGSVSINKGNISFMIRNKEMTKYIVMFLLQFGIIASINKVNKDNRIIISGETNIKKFAQEIRFTHSEKNKKLQTILKNKKINKKQSNIEKIPLISKQIKSLRNKLKIDYKDFPYPHMITGKRDTFSIKSLEEVYELFLNKLKTKKAPIELQELKCLLESDVVWVPVTENKKIHSKVPYVYDLTMQQGNNFIANGILVHNSAAAMYGQLTTGKPIIITSKIQKNKPAHYYELHIDTKKNEPQIINEHVVDWEKDQGTKIKITLEAKYQKGKQGIDEYLKQTAIVNPHLFLTYINPEKQKIEFPRATKELPSEPKEIKPHPYGVELGILIQMLQDTKASTLQSFLKNDFCRVSDKVAKQICEKAGIYEKSRPKRIAREEAENLLKAIKETKIIAPPTNCLSPIGEELILKGLKKEINADFYTAVTRPPSVYRGFPFQVESGIAFGGDISKEDSIRLLRFANKVPLQYQQSACAITRSIITTSWRNYGLSQSKGALPIGPVALLVHIASIWVPFTSESKEAIAHYPEIIKEIKLALQEVGRKLGGFIRKHIRAKEQREKASLFENYIPELAYSLSNLTGEKKEKIQQDLINTLKKGIPELEENGKTEK
ncbi:MAG: DNA topoisomerase VI subunit B [Nanoarchaeota archaeon]|nr:DNA topoisomerase VI subunit B [Nanoarchaeota archaeon]